MRIAQVANFVGPTSGGMRVAIEALGRGYLAAGVERMLLIPGVRDRITETEHGILVEVAAPRISGTYRMIVRPRWAFQLLRRFGPTSVECSDKWTLAGVGDWAHAHGAGAVLLSHERLDDMAANFVRQRIPVATPVRARNHWLANHFDTVVVTSNYSAGEWADTTARLELVPLGVDLDLFTPPARARAVADPGPTRLCYVGRMSHEKDPQLAACAAVELHRRGVPIELHLYGTGPDLPWLRQLAADAPIVFHGFRSDRSAVANAYATSDIALSVSPHETFGLAVLEALACGTPVVTADRGGASELVDGTCGAQGQPSPTGIADAIETLIPRLGDQLRRAARTRAEQYPWDRAAHAMLAVHERVARR